jgi:hypothetical protein
MSQKKVRARLIEPMLLLRPSDSPEGADWEYELKPDGHQALAIKTGGKIQRRSRNDNDFSLRYPSIVKAVAPIADETVLDGEVVALDDSGRPSFNTLQNHGSSKAPGFYYVFDVPILAGQGLQRLQASVQLFPERWSKAIPSTRSIKQLAVFVTQHQRIKCLATNRVSTNDKLLPLLDPHLLPSSGALTEFINVIERALTGRGPVYGSLRPSLTRPRPPRWIEPEWNIFWASSLPLR